MYPDATWAESQMPPSTIRLSSRDVFKMINHEASAHWFKFRFGQ